MADKPRVLFSKDEGKGRIEKALADGTIVRGSDLKRRILSPIPYESARNYNTDEVLRGLGFCEVERFFIQHLPIVVLDVGQCGKTFPTLRRVRQYFEDNETLAYRAPLTKQDNNLVLDTPTNERTVRIWCYDYNGMFEDFEVGVVERKIS